MRKVLVILAVLVFAASFAYAECMVCGNLKSDDVTRTVGSRLGNGLSNAAFGWTEIFFRPGKVVAEGGNPLVGFFRGIGNAIARTAGGVVQVATFWTPGESVVKIDDCPMCAYK